MDILNKIRFIMNEGIINEGIGDTILKQIKEMDKWALPSWGAKDFVKDKNNLSFIVKGSKFRGKVIITLNKKDLYNIEFGSLDKKLNWKVKKKINDVYVDTLVEVIDDFIG